MLFNLLLVCLVLPLSQGLLYPLIKGIDMTLAGQKKVVSTGTGMSMDSHVPVSTRQRNFKSLRSVATGIAALTSFSVVARAGLFESEEQSLVNRISKFQAPVNELLDMLRPTDTPNAVGVYSKVQILKGGKEDSDVVLNYLEYDSFVVNQLITYIK